MTVPKATVHEDYGIPLSKNQVRPPWQFPNILSVTKSQSVQRLADPYFGLRIDGPNGRHVATSLLGGVNVTHRFPPLRIKSPWLSV
jgi:hypothetical protein